MRIAALAASGVGGYSGATFAWGTGAMQLAGLTFRSITARPVVLKLKRPVVARIAAHPDVPGIGLEWNEDAVAAHLAP